MSWQKNEKKTIKRQTAYTPQLGKLKTNLDRYKPELVSVLQNCNYSKLFKPLHCLFCTDIYCGLSKTKTKQLEKIYVIIRNSSGCLEHTRAYTYHVAPSTIMPFKNKNQTTLEKIRYHQEFQQLIAYLLF